MAYTVTDQPEAAAVRAVLDVAHPAMHGIQSVGTAVASIFILFAIFIYVSSILDGGKFQVKMLWPLAIYFLACNFSVVSTPTLAFFRAISNGCYTGSEETFSLVFNSLGIPEEKHTKCNDMYGLWWEANMVKAKQDLEKTKELDEYSVEFLYDTPPSGSSEAGSADGSSPQATSVKISGLSLGNPFGFSEALWKWSNKLIGQMIASLSCATFSGEWDKTNGDIDAWQYTKYGFQSIIAAILDFVLNIVQNAMLYLAAIILVIIISFGPLTWAFAIFPGNQRVIGSWFIRVAQYALWGPLIAMVRCFVNVFFLTNQSSMLHLCTVMVCCLVALTAIPTIASMIIEGAQGSVSLSQGLQTISSSITLAISTLFAPFKAYQAVTNLGEKKRDDDMLNTLNKISENTGGGGPQGMNTHGS